MFQPRLHDLTFIISRKLNGNSWYMLISILFSAMEAGLSKKTRIFRQTPPICYPRKPKSDQLTFITTRELRVMSLASSFLTMNAVQS